MLDVGQVAPSWCLHSSACQFGIGIPKSNLSDISQARAAASEFYTYPGLFKIVKPFPFTTSYFKAFHLFPSNF